MVIIEKINPARVKNLLIRKKVLNRNRTKLSIESNVQVTNFGKRRDKVLLENDPILEVKISLSKSLHASHPLPRRRKNIEAATAVLVKESDTFTVALHLPAAVSAVLPLLVLVQRPRKNDTTFAAKVTKSTCSGDATHPPSTAVICISTAREIYFETG